MRMVTAKRVAGNCNTEWYHDNDTQYILSVLYYIMDYNCTRQTRNIATIHDAGPH